MTEQNFARRLIASAEQALDWTRGTSEIRVTLPGQPARMMTFAEYETARDGADPILAAVADVDAALAEHARIDEDRSLSDDEHTSLSKIAGDRVMTLEKTLDGITPTTMGGLQALVAHHARNDEHPETARRIGAILEGCDSTLRFSALQGGKVETDEHVASANRPSAAEAILASQTAYDAFQAAPDESADLDAALDAQADFLLALSAVLAVPCLNRIEALAVRSHLRWWIEEDREIAEGWQPLYGTAEARVAELTMLLNGGVP